MQIIDAYWEKDNLNTKTNEIICSTEDKDRDLVNALEKTDASYLVLKVPTTNISLSLRAQELGFTLIETSISLEASIKDLAYSPIQQRFIDNSTFKNVDKKTEKDILESIKDGEIFKTDRIAIDPAFSEKVAGNRYYNWTKQLIEEDAKLSATYYKDDLVAFGISKKVDEQVYDAVLGGCLPEYMNKGLGFLAIYTNNKSIELQGGSKITTHVSSNNLPIIKLHLENGYRITNMEYVLVKHQ